MNWPLFIIVMVIVILMMVGFGIKTNECHKKGDEVVRTLGGFYECAKVDK